MATSKSIAPLVWQLLLMALLGLSGVVFVPLLLRCLPAESMAKILVGQVFVYYLVLLVQYGFQWSGPATLAHLDESGERIQFWQDSIYIKLALLLVGLCALIAAIVWIEAKYLSVFGVLLAAYALNSNWYLQSRQDFKAGVLATLAGVIFASLFLAVVWHLDVPEIFLPWVAVLILILPQVLLGTGTYFAVFKVARNSAPESRPNERRTPRIRTVIWADFPIVLSQLLLLGSTTLGTLIVGSLADPETTTAYSATEKLFNLGATVIVGLYMAVYPRLAAHFYKDINAYVRFVWQLFGLIALFSLLGLVLVGFWGDALLGFYLGPHLATLVSPVLAPLSLWLTLCVSQHMVTGYLVLAERRAAVLWSNLLILCITVITGWLAAQILPIYWVYGMLFGQMVASIFLFLIVKTNGRLAL